MKKLFSLFLLISALISFSCSDDATGLGGDDDWGGGGGGGSVTFTIGQRQGNQNGIMFTVKPSTAITITEYTVSLPAQPLSDTYQGDGTTVFQGGQVYDITEYTGVAPGQHWTFNFKGKLGSSTGTAYDVTTNYTIP